MFHIILQINQLHYLLHNISKHQIININNMYNYNRKWHRQKVTIRNKNILQCIFIPYFCYLFNCTYSISYICIEYDFSYLIRATENILFVYALTARQAVQLKQRKVNERQLLHRTVEFGLFCNLRGESRVARLEIYANKFISNTFRPPMRATRFANDSTRNLIIVLGET